MESSTSTIVKPEGDVCVNECPNYGIMLSVFSCAGGGVRGPRQGSPRVLSRRRRFYESYYPTPKRDTFDPKKTASHAPLLGGTTPATKTLPVARRVLGESNQTTLMTRWNYAGAICNDTTATLAELREAVNTLEEVERTARRVLGGSHPLTRTFEDHLRDTRVALAAREDVSKKLKTRQLAQKKSIHQTSIRPGCCPAPKCCPPRRRRRSRDGLLLQQACRRRAG